MSYIKEEGSDIKKIFSRFKRKDFSGPAGQVMENSTYNLATTLIAKFGSLLFTVVIARMLGVELFGLYTLALSTILMLAIFSDLGISTAMITFVSKSLGEKASGRAKTYFKGLLKYKIRLALISSLMIIITGYFIVNYYYIDKPIYLAVLAGIIYIPMAQLLDYLNAAFQAGNNFKAGMIKEIIFQVLRFLILPLGIFYILKTSLEKSVIVASIILLLSFCYFVPLLYLRVIAKRKIEFLGKKARVLTQKEKMELKKFILPLTFTALSGTFFGFIDTFMLGHYVDATHIGYYGATFALIGSAATLIGFVYSSVLPIFSRLKEEALEKIFSKTRNFTLSIGVLATIFTFFMAKLIFIIYDKEFLPGAILLQALSILLVITPMAGIYGTYFISMKKTKTIAILLIASTVINIILNILFITYGLKFGMMQAVIGACLATICSRIFYLAGLIFYKKRLF